MTRHQMRENAFLLTFERLFNDAEPEEILALAKECETVEVDRRVEALFRGIDDKKELLDNEISKYLKNWTLSRISRVSLAVMRVAMYEILFVDDMETDIIISEAVIIAQIYTGKEDVSFINGVLSSVVKKGTAVSPEESVVPAETFDTPEDAVFPSEEE